MIAPARTGRACARAAATSARRRRVAIGLVRALTSVNSAAKPTIRETAEGDAADAACWVADAALAKEQLRPV
jgi:hypothetical protein